MPVAVRFDASTCEKSVRRLMICPRPIFPETTETISHSSASTMKKVRCDGTYAFNPAGLSIVIKTNDSVSITISADNV
jgi:hypothetical protein